MDQSKNCRTYEDDYKALLGPSFDYGEQEPTEDELFAQRNEKETQQQIRNADMRVGNHRGLGKLQDSKIVVQYRIDGQLLGKLRSDQDQKNNNGGDNSNSRTGTDEKPRAEAKNDADERYAPSRIVHHEPGHIAVLT